MDRRGREPKGWMEKLDDWFFPVALVLLVVLAILSTPANAEVDLDPTAVLHRHIMPDGSSHVVLITNVPVLNGTRYVFCMSTSEDWPRLTCLRPATSKALGGNATIWGGVWEGTVAVVGEKRA